MASRLLVTYQIAAAFVLMALLHWATVENSWPWAFAAMVLVAGQCMTSNVLGPRRSHKSIRTAGLVWVGAGGGMALISLLMPVSTAVTAVPVLVNLGLCYHFARTLREGEEPLISRYCRIDFGAVPTECRSYAFWLTALWSALFALLAIECVALRLWVSLETWSLFANCLNFIVIAIVFLGEHVVRTLAFPQLGVASPLRTGRIILQASLSRD